MGALRLEEFERVQAEGGENTAMQHVISLLAAVDDIITTVSDFHISITGYCPANAPMLECTPRTPQVSLRVLRSASSILLHAELLSELSKISFGVSNVLFFCWGLSVFR